MKALTLLAAFVAAVLLACNHAHDTHPVSLNHGEKWQANPETTAGINNMLALVDAFPAAPAPEDYHTLRTNLVTEFDTIFEKCTMTGEAHEQLHNYLVPMQDMLKRLGSDDAAVAQRALDDLKQHLNTYELYFR